MTKIRCAADYFKHDPIALRHCILYEFVQGKPVDTAYAEFCEKFPDYSVESSKVIEKEEFEFWFDQFKQGKFGDDKEIVTDMKEILRNDKRALRACILSELVERENCREVSYGGFILPNIKDDFVRSFKIYIHFREVLGKDVMDYKEFRFRSQRFILTADTSNLDLEYEGTENFIGADVDFDKFDKYLEMLDRLSDMFKDPILLRYCLLFEFLQHKPIEEVFENFCRKIGKKAIDLDTFQYWFNQFEQGIFDDNSEPVADMRDIVQSDQRALRVCILYVSLNYNPFDELSGRRVKLMGDRRFPVYSLFCDIIGENVMKYEEFVYWQIRFSDGKFDLDHERSEKALELTDMPIDIMKDLVQYLSIVDRAKLRRTSKEFLAFIDSQPLFLKEICFRPGGFLLDCSIEICLSSKKTYSKIYIDNQIDKYPDYRECAMEHLKLIFRTPNLHSEHLFIETYGIPTQDEILDGLVSVIDPSTKPRIKSIHIKSAVLEPIVNFLSYLEPGYLESITLDFKYTHRTGFSKMLELEQFKQAKEFDLHSKPFAGSVRDLLHLDSFRAVMATFSAEDFRILREVAFESPTFKDCHLEVKGQFDFDGIRRELDDSSVPGIHEKTFRHFIPNTEDCFEISINTSGISVSRKKDYREEDRRQMEMNNRFRRIQM